MSHEDARKLVNDLPEYADELATVLDFTQGEIEESRRYVVIYVEPKED